MEISNPRLIDQNHTSFTDRTRAGLKARMPFADIKLGGFQHSERKEDCSSRIKGAVRTGHEHYPFIQGLLLVLFVPSIRSVLRLLYPILLYAPRCTVILFCCSVVIFGYKVVKTPIDWQCLLRGIMCSTIK
jgi:hypothetical protein